MKSIFFKLIIPVLLVACDTGAKQESTETGRDKNEVIVLGTIHSGHLKHDEYNLEVLSLLFKISLHTGFFGCDRRNGGRLCEEAKDL